jgi:diguanylate cyclase (GGDEF)-like protein/PAS domain S-box-containing protein
MSEAGSPSHPHDPDPSGDRLTARFRSILDTAQEGIWVTDVAGRTVFANPHMAEILGTEISHVEAASLLDFVDPEERAIVSANDAMTACGEVRRYETMLLRPDRSERWVLVSSAPLADPGTGTTGAFEILHMMTDITDRKRDEAELRRVTLHDGLTGLPNRRLLTDRLARHLVMRTRRPTAVLFLNIDNFKDINNSRGHAVGDEVLVEVALRLSRTARHQDTVARAGGDEFLVLSEDIADIDEAVALAERIRTSLHPPMRCGDTNFLVTASVGIAMSPPSDAAELVRGAGIAMYRAKQNGRNSIAVFDHHNELEVQERVRVQSDLRHAVAHHELEVWYQPIVHLDDARVTGVEALVRWRHPTRGLLLPRAFMSVAESTGLIREIGLDVLETACHDATAWRDPDHPVPVSVNISGLQVVDERLCEQVEVVLEKTGMDPAWLTLEVTESSAMRDRQTADRNLAGLHDLGIRLALDDFGTGYSSLSFLRQFPVEVVKIDQSFVAGIGERTEDELIVAGVISLAHALGHVVIAEGIETIEQRDALQRLGCRWGQGFLWSRAVPLAELAGTIARIERSRDEEPILAPR